MIAGYSRSIPSRNIYTDMNSTARVREFGGFICLRCDSEDGGHEVPGGHF